jgi:hypothetical protein
MPQYSARTVRNRALHRTHVQQVGCAARQLEHSFWKHFKNLVPTHQIVKPAWLTVSDDAAVDSVDKTGFGGWWGSLTPGERDKTEAARRWACESMLLHVHFDSETMRLTDGGTAVVTAWVNHYKLLVGELLATISLCGDAQSRSTELASLA